MQGESAWEADILLSGMESEESPTIDPQRREVRGPSPESIHWQDSEDTIERKKKQATREIRDLTDAWCALYRKTQWSLCVPCCAEMVLHSPGLLRQILPFVRQVKNLDGKIWVRTWASVDDDDHRHRAYATDHRHLLVYPRRCEPSWS